MEDESRPVESVPCDRPYVIDEIDDRRAVVRFGRRVDHPRLGNVESFERVLRSRTHVACDLSATETIISGWIRVLRDKSIEARASGAVLGIVGMGEELRESADVIKAREDLMFFASVDEVWAT